MPCIDESGKLSESGEALIKSILSDELTVKEISSRINIPIFKVRSSIRELLEADLIEKIGESYKSTEKGKNLIQNQ
ncbi:MAG: hypothetical protein ACTSRG_09710 [Candidatus Helarchaeota archaeon]